MKTAIGRSRDRQLNREKQKSSQDYLGEELKHPILTIKRDSKNNTSKGQFFRVTDSKRIQVLRRVYHRYFQHYPSAQEDDRFKKEPLSRRMAESIRNFEALSRD